MSAPRIIRSPFRSEREIHSLGRCGFCFGCSYRTPCLTLQHTLTIFRKEYANDQRALKHIHAAFAPARRALVRAFLLRVARGELGAVAERADAWRVKQAEEDAWYATHCHNCGNEKTTAGDFCSYVCSYDSEDDEWFR